MPHPKRKPVVTYCDPHGHTVDICEECEAWLAYSRTEHDGTVRRLMYMVQWDRPESEQRARVVAGPHDGVCQICPCQERTETMPFDPRGADAPPPDTAAEAIHALGRAVDAELRLTALAQWFAADWQRVAALGAVLAALIGGSAWGEWAQGVR